jgi:Icc-related predicted phosphoesterase
MLAEDSPETTKNIALIETKRKLLKFVESNPADIILSHFSCAGVMSGANLMYRGLKTLRTYIERNSPRYLFHGHLHNPDEFEFLGTRIVQVYPWKRVSFKG